MNPTNNLLRWLSYMLHYLQMHLITTQLTNAVKCIHVCYYVIYIFSISYPAHLNYISSSNYISNKYISYIFSRYVHIYLTASCFSIHLYKCQNSESSLRFWFRISNLIYKIRHKSRIFIYSLNKLIQWLYGIKNKTRI